ncbi:MAG: RNA polymerase sigma factor [Lachnospiraceae bacterium]
MSEQEIIELYLARNEDAVRKSEEVYGAYCHTIAHRILQDEGEAAECVNDTWFQAWRTIPPTIPNNLGAYLAKITRNLSLNRYRRAHQKKREADRVSTCLDELQECVAGGITPEQVMEQKYLSEVISDFLRGLSKEERVMFVRRYFYMDSVAEVAAHLNCSESKVKTTMFRCRKKLQKILIREEVSA